MLNINNLRKEYRLKSLDLKDLNDDPFQQFKSWFEDAQMAQILEPNALILSTASLEAKPSSRALLLKQMDDKGFIFFTNYESRKSHELQKNPYASALFLWKEVERQVTIEGTVEKITREESKTYFASRPRWNQIGSWASRQGQIIPSRQVLENEYQRLENEWEGQEIPYPSFWGGYRLIPHRFEFWQGRPNRLHDRFQYRVKESGWHIDRLSP